MSVSTNVLSPLTLTSQSLSYPALIPACKNKLEENWSVFKVIYGGLLYSFFLGEGREVKLKL